MCNPGANRAKGLGYNELYLTLPDGQLSKVERHGLQRHPSLSTTVAARLTHRATRDALVFVGTRGKPRDDMKATEHRMFRVTGEAPEYFEEVPGCVPFVWGMMCAKKCFSYYCVVLLPCELTPIHFSVPLFSRCALCRLKKRPWNKQYHAICAVPADVNGDGIQDLIVCDKTGTGHIYIQQLNGQFHELQLPNSPNLKPWRNVRVGRVTKRSTTRPDLIVVEGHKDEPAFLRIFAGIDRAPWFNFHRPFLVESLPHAAVDLEILDVNQDNIKDICKLGGNFELLLYPTGHLQLCSSNVPFLFPRCCTKQRERKVLWYS